MAVDLKLVQWINANKTRLSRAEVVAELKRQGYPEPDIVDSYERVVAGAVLPSQRKDLVATVLLSVVFPGAGHLYLGRTGTGATLLVLAALGWLMNVTLVGMVLGVPLLFVVTLAAVLSAVATCNRLNRGEL
jgi:TM2 domain-containing membrane protein YozV